MTRTTTFVAIAFVLLVALTTSLASFYHEERTARAAAHFERGREDRASGSLGKAATEFRTALSLARDRADYELALGLTLLEAGHMREAVSYLDDVLRVDPTSGVANRARAEAARSLNETGDAVAFYRRAIHGVWPPDEADDRQATRLAFVEFLLSQGGRAEARGELGSLAAEVAVDSPSRVRIAALMLAASAPDQAAEVLRATTEALPEDARAWRLLAEAEFALGAYRATAGAAKRALALGPADADTARRLELAESVMAMDPMVPRLPTRERERRSLQLLDMALASLDACLEAARATPSPETVELKRAVAEQLEPRRGRDAAPIDARLGMAELTWRTARRLCPAVPANEAPVDLLMRRLMGAEKGS